GAITGYRFSNGLALVAAVRANCDLANARMPPGSRQDQPPRRRLCRNRPSWQLPGSSPDGGRLMVVPGHPGAAGDIAVFHCRLQHHAFAELVDHGALDLLPGGLVLRVPVAAAGLEFCATPRKLGV